MAPSALVTTAGAATANAYCTVAEADAYHENLPLAAVRVIWTAASTDDKTRAILTATRLIDGTFDFIGGRVTTTQALAWPRYLTAASGWSGSFYDYWNGSWSWNGYAIDSTTIPQRVKDATAEYARQLLVADRTADPSTAGSAGGIKRLKADVIEIEYFGSDGIIPGKPVPDAVSLLLAGLGFLFGVQRSVPLMRV